MKPQEPFSTKSIEELMTRHPLTIGYEEGLEKASEMMIQHRFRHLPVTDHLGEVIGILSDRDIQRAMQVRRQGVEIEVTLPRNRKVKDFMSWPPHSVKDHTPLREALQFMISEKISALLVTSAQSGKVRGILTTEDLLREFERLLETPPPLGYPQLLKS